MTRDRALGEHVNLKIEVRPCQQGVVDGGSAKSFFRVIRSGVGTAGHC